MKEHTKAWKFRKMYSNILVPLRNEIMVYIDGEPMSCDVVYHEVQNKTQMGYDAIEQLIRIGVLI